MILIVMSIILFELIQMLLSRRKILRYILPIITYIFSLFNIYGLVIYDIHSSDTITLTQIISWIWIFFIFNIPTILFCITNICMKKKEKKYIIIYIIINIILLTPIARLV